MKATIDEVIEAAERGDGTGFCVDCGHEQSGVEPDARRYQCECCGEFSVFGAEQCVLEGFVS